MIYGIIFSIISILGIITGIKKKSRFLTIISLIVLLFVIAVWGYFYMNPY